MPPLPPRRELALRARRRIALRSAVEPLEGRLLLATFTVNTLADAADVSPGSGTALTAAGKISLRSAVQEANALGGSNTINLPAGTYPLTIAPVAGDDTAASGALDVTSDLTLVGAGSNTTTIDASAIPDRVLDVRGAVTVAVSGVTITGGSGDVDNPVGSAPANLFTTGGGVSLSGGTLTLTNSVVSRNHAYAVTGGGAPGGAGVFNSGGNLTLDHTAVRGNTFALPDNTPSLVGNGAGIYNVGGQLTLNTSTVGGNDSNGGAGGGVYSGSGLINQVNKVGTLTATNSTINGNTAGLGAGLFNFGMATLTDCTVNGNTAGVAGIQAGIGGGISNRGQLILNTTSVNGNVANNSSSRPGLGGGIYDSEYGGGNSSMLTGDTINGNTAGLGGGIYHGTGRLTATGGTVTGNNAEDGGGFYDTSLFTQNASTAQVTLSNVSLVGNQATADASIGYGGAGNGGGIYNGGGIFSLDKSTVDGNGASAGTGGVPTTEGNRVGDGGGIFDYKAGGGNVDTVTNSTISNNGAINGGGIFHQTGTLTLAESTITGNTATNLGGGVLVGPTVATETPPTGEATAGSITGVTIAANSAPAAGAGLLVVGAGSVTIRNSIVARDTNGPDFGLTPDSSGGGITSTGHNLIGDTSGASVFTASGDQNNVDPKLGPLADNGGPSKTLALLPGSPAIDAGDPAGAPATDQRGLNRIQGAGIDIGAFEVGNATSSPVVTVAGTASAAVTLPGDIVYTLTVPNTGPAPATGVAVTDTLPAGVTFRSAAFSQGNGSVSSSNGVVTLTLGNLAAGATDTITLTATPSAAGTLTNSATVKSDQTAATAPVTQNTVVTASATRPTTTTLTAAPNPSTQGQDVTFTAVVNAGYGAGGVAPAAETVTFTIDSRPGATVPIHVVNGHGQATYHTSSLGVGTHTVVASYSGTAEYGPSTSNTLTETVKVATTLSAVASPVIVVGQSVLVDATLALVTQSTVTPTGNVTLTVDGKPVPALPLGSDLTEHFSLSGLKAGTHHYTASYAGDTTFGASQATPGTFTVDPAATQTTLTSSPNPSAAGQRVTFTADVVPLTSVLPDSVHAHAVQVHAVHSRLTALPAGYPPFAGTVTFKDGSTVLATVPVHPDGSATFTTSSLPPGRHNVTAVFGNDPDYTPSASPAVAQVVKPSLAGPRVVLVQRYGYHQAPTVLVVTFNGPLNPTTAGNVLNYRIASSNGRVTIPVTFASYNPVAHTVTLYPRSRLDLHYRYTLTIFGSTAGRVAGAGGSLLDGAGTGHPGSDYVTVIDAANLVVTNPFAAGATAALQLSARVRAADAGAFLR